MDYREMKIIEYRARIDAVMCKVEAMKAANVQRENMNQAQAYHDACFFDAEREIEGWANSIMRLAEDINEGYLEINTSPIPPEVLFGVNAVKEEREEVEEERYDCPIHGLQDGPDCPRC